MFTKAVFGPYPERRPSHIFRAVTVLQITDSDSEFAVGLDSGFPWGKAE